MTAFVGNHGLLAVFVLMFVAAILPAASELTMVYGGALASGALAGHIAHFRPGFHAYVAVVVTGVVANTLGAVFGWSIGFYGEPVIERHGRWLHITEARIQRADRWFDRFGLVAVPLGFATPVIRSFVAIPAGVFRWPLARLVVLAAGGCLVFCSGVAGIGWAVGSSWHAASHDLRYVDYVVAVGIVAAAAYLIVKRRRATISARHVDSTR